MKNQKIEKQKTKYRKTKMVSGPPGLPYVSVFLAPKFPAIRTAVASRENKVDSFINKKRKNQSYDQ